MNKVLEVLIGLILLIITVLSIMNGYCNNEFWQISIYQILSLLLMIIISYLFSRKFSNRNKQKNIMESVLIDIQTMTTNEKTYKIDRDSNYKDLLIVINDIKFSISVLEEYAKSFNFTNEFEYIRVEYNAYDEMISMYNSKMECYESNQHILRKHISNINKKCLSIRMKLYE